MENINKESIQSFSVTELNALYNKTCDQLLELDEQIDRLKTTRTEHLLFRDIIHEARARKKEEEIKEKYEKYIGKYYVCEEDSTNLIYYHFKSIEFYHSYVRLLGTSVTPFNYIINPDDHFDVCVPYEVYTNMLKEISKDEFKKRLQDVVKTL